MTNTEVNQKNTPDPEVKAKRPRRRFTASYKLDILKQVDKCANRGEVGSLLRREALYSSHLTQWRKQKEQGLLAPHTSPKRGRKPKAARTSSEYDELERHCQSLERRLKQAEAIIDVQKKVSEIFGGTLNPLQMNGAKS
jgi:transposase